MRTRTILHTLLMLGLAWPAAVAQERDTIRSRARGLMETHQDAVVHIKVAIKQTMSFGGQDLPGQDQQIEVTGTVIDPSGLAVVSESDIDPMSFVMGMMGGILGGAGLDGAFDSKSDVTDVKMVLADGKEIPARLVLRDKDLDLAFVAPRDKGLKLTHVSLDGEARAEFFDEIFVLRRLDRSLDRQPALGLARISAIVKKPRVFYVPDAAESLGCPVFDRQGKTLGITVRRRGAQAAGGGALNFAALAGGMSAVVLPSGDVKEVADQALAEAAKESPKKTNEPN